MFNFVPDIEPLTLNASLTAAGTTVTSSAGIELIKNPNPFILHGDTAHGYPWYLSVDTRVFQMKAGQTRFGAHVGTSGAARDVATTFIQQGHHQPQWQPGIGRRAVRCPSTGRERRLAGAGSQRRKRSASLQLCPGARSLSRRHPGQ